VSIHVVYFTGEPVYDWIFVLLFARVLSVDFDEPFDNIWDWEGIEGKRGN
jgi:hypothetical protein